MSSPLPLTASALFIVLVFALLYFLLKYLLRVLCTSSNNSKGSKIYFGFAFISITLWLILLAIIAQTGFLQNFIAIPPHFLIVVLPPLVVIILLSFSAKVMLVLKHVSLKHLIYIQTFRVIMELILWILYRDKIIPVQMTFEGYNYDILVGISAFIVAYYYSFGLALFNNKWFLICWNLAGIALLINIVSIAILSTPSPFRFFMNEPANTVIAYFPFVWLPGFVVPFALTMHLFAIKKLITNDFEMAIVEHNH